MHNTRQSIVEHPLAGMMKSTPSHVLISTESRRSTLPQTGGVELRNAIVSITNVSRVGCSAGLLKRRRWLYHPALFLQQGRLFRFGTASVAWIARGTRVCCFAEEVLTKIRDE